jgi:hypothetical protein
MSERATAPTPALARGPRSRQTKAVGRRYRGGRTAAKSPGRRSRSQSASLASLMLAQLSERAELREVFDELFDAAGASIVLRPAKRFCPNESATFAEIVAAGNHFSESVLGYRTASDGRIVLNPMKSARLALQPEDEVVVVTTR